VKNLVEFETMLERTLGGLGYEFAGCERAGRTGLLRVFIDKAGGVDVEDCAQVSNHLIRLFAVEGIEYGRLEISSPGLDRVLRSERDFARFSGEQARVRLRVPHEGQRNFIGTMRSVQDGRLELDVDGRSIMVELANVERARLVPKL
jgi:ribosome maturation factor RimP